MNKYFLFLVLLCCISFQSAYSNGISLNSPGARALGMGGAMVGLADGPMTIYWNPAGMSNFDKPMVSFFAMDVIPKSEYKFDTYKIDATAKTNHYISPNLTGYLPLMDGKMTLGFGAYVSSGLGVEWEGDDLKAFSGASGTAFEWYNYVRNINFAPAISYKITDQLYVGAAINIKYGMLDMRRPLDLMNTTGTTPMPGEDGAMDTQYEESSSGIGVGFTAGILYKPMEELSMGLTFRSPAKISLSGDAENPTMALLQLPGESSFDRDLTTPMWIAGGIAVKPMKDLTITLDGQWSQWSESAEYLETTYNDWNNQLDTMHLKWEDCLQIRVGAEYMATDKLALRAGYYNDPAPSPDKTLTIMFPSITFNAFTVGTGYNFGSFGVDLGIEYLAGSEREILLADTMKEDWHAMPGTHSMNIFAVSLGFNYYFD